MPRLKSDLAAALLPPATACSKDFTLRWSDEAALTVVMAARGYPGAVEKGSEIRGVDEAEALPDVLVFHAGTKQDGDRLVANGGRVLDVTATGRTVTEAQAQRLRGGRAGSTGRRASAGAISAGGRWRANAAD